MSTRALITCVTSKIDIGIASSSESIGDSIVSIEGRERGIGLKWIASDTLEVALPQDANISEKKYRFSYGDNTVRYEYKLLSTKDPEYNGCKNRSVKSEN